MAVYKVTFGLVQYTFGATESYFTGDLTPSALGPVVQQLLDRRNDLLFDTTLWTGVRVGLADGSRRAAFYPPGNYSLANSGIELAVPARGTIAATAIARRSDQARSCMQMRIGFDTDRKSVRYLAFVPDSIILDEPASVDLAKDPAWGSTFVNFRNELISGRWFVRGRNRGAGFTELPIRGWTQSATAPNLTGIILDSAPAPGIVVGDFVVVKGSRRRGTDKMSYNGRYYIPSINTTLVPDSIVLWLGSSEAGDPASIKLPGKVQRVGMTYFPIQICTSLRGGVHKRGKPLGSPHGRRQKRVLLDP